MDTAPNASSEQDLRRLREEGRITEAEYEELLAALQKAPTHAEGGPKGPGSGTPPWPVMPGRRNMPSVMGVALLSLGLMVLGKVLVAYRAGPMLLIDAALSATLLVGLYLGHKWAYVLTIVFTAIGTIAALAKGIDNGLVVLVGDCLVLVPVILSTDYFFAKPEEMRRA